MSGNPGIIVKRATGHEPKQKIVVRLVVPKAAKGLLKAGSGTIEELNLSDTDVYTQELPDGRKIDWVLPHSKRFIDFINRHFGENPEYISNKVDFIKEIQEAMASGSDAPPFAYQKFIRDYMAYGTPYRSLLLEHGLGSGKSRSGIMVAETFRAQGLMILIMTPAFLRLNFMDEIERWGGPDIRIVPEMAEEEKTRRRNLINQYYKFVHYNATGYGLKRTKSGTNVAGKGSVFEQLARLGIGFNQEDPEFGHVFPYLNQRYGNLYPPNRMLIIIEEIHNLNRSFIKGAQKLRYFLYPLLMKARDCKIIGLSGTPIVNSPFEMASLYNMLRGPMGKDGKGRTLPEDESHFNDMFVDYAGLRILRGSDILPTRILGLGSLFKGITDDKERIIYPAGNGEGERIIDEIQLPEYQATYHDAIFAMETGLKKDRSRKFLNLTRADVSRAIDEAQKALEPNDSYYTRSRQACNFAFPKEVPRPRPGRKGAAEAGGDRWAALADTVFRFNPTTAVKPKELEHVWNFFVKIDADLSDYEPDWDIYKEVDTEDEEVMERVREMFTIIIKTNYATNPPLNGKHPVIAAGILADVDHRDILRVMGDYKQRLNIAMEDLLAGADKFLTVNALENMYSAKMALIYKRIITDIDNGALWVDSSTHTKKVSPKNKVAVEDGTEAPIDPDAVDDIEANPEDDVDDATAKEAAASAADGIDLSNIKVNTIVDPSDPMQGPDGKKYRDAYLPDEQIVGTVRGGPAMVYSFFNTVEGVGLFSKVLEAHGFKEYRSEDTDDAKLLARAPRFAFVKGGMNPNYKAKIMRIFNSQQNAHGQLIRVIFVTQAAAEGISLFHLRQVHIMEPHWENTMIDQVIGRAFRLRSHRYLDDPEERRVQIYMYRALTRGVGGTADLIVQGIADRKTHLLDQLRNCRAMAAVDCRLNSEYNKLDVPCLNFSGSTGAAFTASIETDIKRTDRTITKTVSCPFQIHQSPKTGSEYIELLNRQRVTIEIETKGRTIRVPAAILYIVTTPGWTRDQPIVESQLKKWGYQFELQVQGKKQNIISEIKSNIKEI